MTSDYITYCNGCHVVKWSCKILPKAIEDGQLNTLFFLMRHKSVLYDLFVSYRHQDGNRVRAVVAALRDLGLAVWFDENSIDDFDAITGAIREGLACSKALLAWYSETYPQSRPCQMELTAAYIAAGHATNRSARILVVNPEEDNKHILPAALRDNLFLTADLSPTILARRIVDHLAKIDEVLGAILPITLPPQHGSHITGSSRFVGRLTELWNLHDRLHTGERAIISGGFGPDSAQVTGMGGQGKSLLAEEYALRFGAAYTGGVFWLRAYGHDDSITSNSLKEQEVYRDAVFRDIAQRLGLSVQDKTMAQLEGELGRTLRKKRQPFLWVVDDLAFGLTMDAVRSWYAPDSIGKTLITTRSREYGSAPDRLDLEVLKPAQAVQLFLSHHHEQQPPPNDTENQLAWEIAVNRLGCHALAVDVAGGAAQQIGYAEFLHKLDDCNEDVLDLAAQLGSQLPNGHQKNIAATFLSSLELLDEAGLDYLRLAASLAPAPISHNMVSLIFAKIDNLSPSQADTKALLATNQVSKFSLAEAQLTEQQGQMVHLYHPHSILSRFAP